MPLEVGHGSGQIQTSIVSRWIVQHFLIFFFFNVTDPAEVTAHILRVSITGHHMIQF